MSDPALLPVTFEGKRPGHVVPHDDHVILFYDRGDQAEIIGEADILDGNPKKRIIATIKPNRGVAVTMGRSCPRLRA